MQAININHITNNPQATADKELLKGALDALKETTGTIAHLVQMQPKAAKNIVADAVLEVKRGTNKIRYFVEIKRTLPTGALGHVVAQLQRFKKPGMLIARYITPPMAERLRELDVPFIDTAGNAYINAPPLFVYVTGRKLPELNIGDNLLYPSHVIFKD